VDLLTIGEFSDRCGLSPKMLRTYAATGLLPPAGVDRGSGYRFYAPYQVHRARIIGLLRRAGTPLRDIASFLASPAAERLDQWHKDLTTELADRRQALEEVRACLPPALAGAGPDVQELRQEGESMTRLSTGSASNAGTMRSVNQDAVLAGDCVFAVADGMGERGQIASVLAVEILQACFTAAQTATGLVKACHSANRSVWRRAGEDTELTMGTTLTAAGIVSSGDGESLAIAHVGDTRAYLLRHGAVRRLTEDHTVVADLVRAGELTGAAARVHPRRSLLTRALGTGPDVEPDLVLVRPEPGDRLLLCTDGLFNELDDHEITAALAANSEPDGAAEQLIGTAARRGGQDDTSAVVIDTAGP
jgi:protein phosphatase